MENPGKDRKASGGYGESWIDGEWVPVANDVPSNHQGEDYTFDIPNLQERMPEITPNSPSLDNIFPEGFHKYIKDAPAPKKQPPRGRLN